MKAACFIAVPAILCFSGCSTPGSQYAKAHPELTQAHREILINGNIPGGLAVEGMTKEQVMLAAGNPTRVERLSEGEAWVYVHETFVDKDAGGADDAASKSKGGWGSKQSGKMGARQGMVEKKTVFFQGDRATQTQITKERE